MAIGDCKNVLDNKLGRAIMKFVNLAKSLPTDLFINTYFRSERVYFPLHCVRRYMPAKNSKRKERKNKKRKKYVKAQKMQS